MVQLKVIFRWQASATFDNFNSAMVQLKVHRLAPAFQNVSYFNSAMVQLKAVLTAKKYAGYQAIVLSKLHFLFL